MSKVMTAEQFRLKSDLLPDLSPLLCSDGLHLNGNERIDKLLKEYSKYLLEAHKEAILKKQRLSELHTVAFVYIDDIEQAHKQFLANL